MTTKSEDIKAADRVCPQCDGPKSAYAPICEKCENK